MAAPERRLAAILFTDIVGFSALTQADEPGSLKILEQHNQLLRPIFARFHGREVKTIGDAFLVEFSSALDAVLCAIEIQETLHELEPQASGSPKIRIRIGIHLGDVVRSDGDVLGDAVNIASRVVPLADPEGICLTQQVYDHVRNKIPLPLVRMAPAVLKNIRLPVNLYRIVPPWQASTDGPGVIEGQPRHTLAILPLASISPDPGDAYFADGLTDELISVLSQVPGLCITARTSVVQYRNAPKSVAQIASELGVDTVLEGSVRKAGQRIRIALQLVDAATQQPVWATSYDRELNDVFQVQSDIAKQTADTLQLKLRRTDDHRLVRRPTENIAAYDLYLRALAAMADARGARYDNAVRCFEQATRLDPKFAEAYGAWANLYVAIAGISAPMREVIPRARELAARALAIDPDSSDAHAAIANIAFQFDHNWKVAEEEFERAIELNPSNVTALTFYGSCLVAEGKFERAKEVVRRAILLDPAGRARSLLAWAELLEGNVKAAIEYAEGERDSEPGSVHNHLYLGFYYLFAGMRDPAVREADTPLQGADEEEKFDHALLSALVGRPRAARELAREIEAGRARSYNSATDLALLYGALGERARALDLLEKDLREGDTLLWSYYRGVWFDSIRDDPRFIDLLRAYGLPLEPPHRTSPGSPGTDVTAGESYPRG